MRKTEFRKRIRGTERQKGKPFPLKRADKKTLPRTLKLARETRAEKKSAKLTRETRKTASEMKGKGYKGYTVGVEYKDGTSEVIQTKARNEKNALVKVEPKLKQPDKNVREVVVVDPSMGERMHKLGSSAVSSIKLAGRGAKILSKYAVKGAEVAVKGAKVAVKGAAQVKGAVIHGVKGTARGIGKVAATRDIVKAEYGIGKKEAFSPYTGERVLEPERRERGVTGTIVSRVKGTARGVGKVAATKDVVKEEYRLGKEEAFGPYKGTAFASKSPFSTPEEIENGVGIPAETVKREHIVSVDSEGEEVVQEIPVHGRLVKRITTIEEFLA